MTQKHHKPHFHHLKHKWIDRHHKLHTNLWDKHKDALDWLENSAKHLVAGSLASIIMFAHPLNSTVAKHFHTGDSHVLESNIDPYTQFRINLKSLLPETVKPLTKDQEKKIGAYLTDYFKMPVSAELEGKRLNRSYGLIGAEQHLMRYPGDTMATHFSTPAETIYTSSGMAPGRGAWGYFTKSQHEMTPKDIDREKYYIAVQTFLSPGFMQNVREHYSFYKYRKMLVVNPDNGKAMVVVIGDAGPAPWTGKHLGGSPEVMSFLERKDGRARGPVLYFFIDDPEDKIPLGPIETK